MTKLERTLMQLLRAVTNEVDIIKTRLEEIGIYIDPDNSTAVDNIMDACTKVLYDGLSDIILDRYYDTSSDEACQRTNDLFMKEISDTCCINCEDIDGLFIYLPFMIANDYENFIKFTDMYICNTAELSYIVHDSYEGSDEQ